MENIGLYDVNFLFRYDGLDVEKYEIEFFSFGESLKGFSKILVIVGIFVLI